MSYPYHDGRPDEGRARWLDWTLLALLALDGICLVLIVVGACTVYRWAT